MLDILEDAKPVREIRRDPGARHPKEYANDQHLDDSSPTRLSSRDGIKLRICCDKLFFSFIFDVWMRSLINPFMQ